MLIVYIYLSIFITFEYYDNGTPVQILGHVTALNSNSFTLRVKTDTKKIEGDSFQTQSYLGQYPK
jgi:hypothetical protein